jgi:hypothetical protein
LGLVTRARLARARISMTHPVERSYYRIVFPLTEQPVLILEGQQYAVVDCSEHGLRFVRTLALPLEVGKVVRGVVRFRRGAEVDVEGEVVRLQGEHAALNLNVTPIPMATIFDEQRYLRTRYPMRR